MFIPDNQVTVASSQGASNVPSTSRDFFRPWDVKESGTSGLDLLAEAVNIRSSNDYRSSDVEMSGVGNEALPFIGQPPVVPQLIDVGNDPVFSPNVPVMATVDDLQHVFDDVSDVDLGIVTPEVEEAMSEIDNYISGFEFPSYSEYSQE